jgi:hypothetical protein
MAELLQVLNHPDAPHTEHATLAAAPAKSAVVSTRRTLWHMAELSKVLDRLDGKWGAGGDCV